MVEKTAGAFRTIGELSEELGVPQHILRYWETRFSQLRPLTRAGNRRYYRAEDVALVRHIHTLLSENGYTIKGVQKLLSGKTQTIDVSQNVAAAPVSASIIPQLKAIRDQLAYALASA